jgi:hypothetical protein
MSAHRKQIGVERSGVENIAKSLRQKHVGEWIRCSHGHLNSPNADICWKCEEPLERAVSEART